MTEKYRPIGAAMRTGSVLGEIPNDEADCPDSIYRERVFLCDVMCAKKRPNCACQLPDLSHIIQGCQK